MTDKMFNDGEMDNKTSGITPAEEFVPDFGDEPSVSTADKSGEESISNDFIAMMQNEPIDDIPAKEQEGSPSDKAVSDESTEYKAEETQTLLTESEPMVQDNVQHAADNATETQYQPRYSNYNAGAFPPYGYSNPQMNDAGNAGAAHDGSSAPQYQTNNGVTNGTPDTVNSGEYRYRPPYATYGSNCPPPRDGVAGGTVVPPNTKPIKEKKKKVKTRNFTTGAVALVLIACIILSFGAGFGGAYVANVLVAPLNNTPPSTDVGTNNQSGESIIMYKSAMVADEEGEEIDGDLSVSSVADIVADSVVEITTEFQSSYGPYQFVSEGAGSGVIVSENGHIITNNHVIVDESNNVSDSITVRLKDTTEYKAKFIGADADMDIAVLKIEPTSEIKPAILGDSTSLKVGQQVVAVGNPLGELGGTVTSGIVSATGRTIDVGGVSMTLIQTDAAVNPGNSGGGLFNLKGELVGIVNAKSTGEGVEGLGFAIPYDEAGKVAEELMEFGYVKGKPYIGVSFIDITNAFDAYRYFGTRTLGVYVSSTEEGYNDGVLKKGDRVVKVNDTEIATTDEIRAIVKGSQVGDVLTFTIFRDGAMTEVEVTCYENVPEELR